MRRLLALPAALLAVLAWAAPAFGHAAYVGSEPAPGQRLERSPARVVLVFTEPLNGRLARRDAAARVDGGAEVPASVRPEGKRLVVTPVARAGHGRLPGRLAHGLHRGRPRARGRVLVRRARGRRARRPRWRPGRWRAAASCGSSPRIALYATILVLAAALLLPLLIGRPRGWPVPELDPGDEGGRVELEEVRARERRLRGDLAWAAVAAAVVATFADAADAARGARPRPDGRLPRGQPRRRRPRARGRGAARRRRCCATAARAPRPPRSCSRSAPSPPRATPARPTRACRASSTTGCTSSRARCGSAGSACWCCCGGPSCASRAAARASRSRARCSRRSGASRPARSWSRSRPGSSRSSPSSAASPRCGTPPTGGCWRSRSSSSG